MKNIYLSALLLGTASVAFAQEDSQLRTPPAEVPNLAVPTGKPIANVGGEEKALNILWSDDFSGGTGPLETAQGTWTVAGTNGGYWDISNAAHPLSGNGWTNAMNAEHAIWDSYNPISTAGEPGGFSTTATDGALISPSIALTGNTNSIGVQFITETMFCCNYQELPWGISVSIDDGATWSDTVTFDFMVERNEPTEDIAHPMTVGVNLDAIAPAGPQAQFKFKLIWDGSAMDPNGQYNSHYFWMVDDFKIYEIPANDIALIAGYHNDIINDWEYSMLPTTQSTNREMVPTLIVLNQGSADQTVDITCEISEGGSVVNTTVETVTIPVGVQDTVYFNTSFMPSTNGTYSTSFSIPADDDPSDDTWDASDLTVDANLMAHDYGATSSYGWDPASTNTTIQGWAQAPHSYGNLYTPAVDQEIYGVDVAIETGTTPGLYVLARVQELTTTSIQDPLNWIAEKDYTIQNTDINGVVTIIFDSPAMLTAGNSYIIDLYKVDGTTTEGFYVGGSEANGEDDDFSTVNYGPYGASNAVNYWLSWGYSPYVRANFDASLGIDENATLEGVSVYPNPSEGIVNISNDNNVEHTVEVRNMAGQLISMDTTSSATTVDLTNEAAGVYVVKVSNENGVMVEKVTIK